MTLLRNAFTAAASLGGTAWSWVKGKARLIIEYALLAAFVSLAGFTIATWVQRRELAGRVTELSQTVGGLSGSLQQQVDINHQQDQAITELRRLRGLDSQALTGLQKELADAGKKGDNLRQRIAQLEKTNEQARALLDTPVPTELGCLLDGRPCPAAGHGNQGHPPASR